MKISILTPSFNSGKYIDQSIMSVLDQDFTNIEHIISDNYSVDETHSILKKYKHLKVYIKKDEGQSDALNWMLKKSSGEIIGWLNADDYYSPNIFKKIVKYFIDNPNVDAVYGNYNIVDDKNNYLRNVNVLRFISSFLPFICFIPSTTFFFRSRIIKKNKINLNIKYFYMMDKEFFCQITKKTKNIVKLDKVIASFRIHNDAKTSFSLNRNSKKNFYFEGIDIINNYSLFKLRKDYSGILIYKFITFFFNILSFFIKKLKL